MLTKTIIDANIERIRRGNVGHPKSVGNGVFEKKIDYAGGLRLYFTKRNNTWIILLCGGDKSTQDKDIKLAHKLKQEVT